jgi:hypothetical protein
VWRVCIVRDDDGVHRGGMHWTGEMEMRHEHGLGLLAVLA